MKYDFIDDDFVEIGNKKYSIKTISKFQKTFIFFAVFFLIIGLITLPFGIGILFILFSIPFFLFSKAYSGIVKKHKNRTLSSFKNNEEKEDQKENSDKNFYVDNGFPVYESNKPNETFTYEQPISKIPQNKKISKQLFEKVVDDYYLKYSYDDVAIVGVKYRNLDYNEIKNGFVRFEFEKTNEYDPNAIKVLQGDIHIGYIKKDSSINDMLHNYLEKQQWQIFAWLKEIDEETEKLYIQIAFYKKITNDMKKIFSKTARLVKTTKKDEFFDRQENLSCIDENEYVKLEYQYDSDCLLVLSDTGDELGELNASLSSKLEDYLEDGIMICKVVELDENESGKIICTVNISVYEE